MSCDGPERKPMTQSEEIEYLAKRLCRLSDRSKGRMRRIRDLERALENSEARRRIMIESILSVLKPEEQQQIMNAISTGGVSARTKGRT